MNILTVPIAYQAAPPSELGIRKRPKAVPVGCSAGFSRELDATRLARLATVTIKES